MPRRLNGRICFYHALHWVRLMFFSFFLHCSCGGICQTQQVNLCLFIYHTVQNPNASLISYDLPPEEFASSLAGYSLYVTSEPFRADPDARFMAVAVPVGQIGDLAQVSFGTVLTIVVMFLYVAYISYTTARRLGKRVKLVKGE